jgi:hypothetical protein
MRFSLNSPRVPKLFPKKFPIAPQILSHMVCPKFNSNVHKLKKDYENSTISPCKNIPNFQKNPLKKKPKPFKRS